MRERADFASILIGRDGMSERVKGGKALCAKYIVSSGLRTSRPKARDGHRYPCPVLVFCNGSSYGSRAAAPEGTRGDKAL